MRHALRAALPHAQRVLAHGRKMTPHGVESAPRRRSRAFQITFGQAYRFDRQPSSDDSIERFNGKNFVHFVDELFEFSGTDVIVFSFGIEGDQVN